MATDFKVSDIIDSKAIEEVNKLGAAFDATADKYANLTKALAGGIKINPKSISELSQKQKSQNEILKELAETQNKLASIQEEYKKLLAQVSEQIKKKTSSVVDEANANKANAEAELASAKAKTEQIKQSRLLEQQNRKRKASEEEIANALRTEAQSITQATEQNRILRQAVKEVVGTDEQALKQRAKLNQKINENTDFIKKNSDAYTQQKMDIGGYSDAIQKAFDKMGFGSGVVKKLLDSFKNLGSSSSESSAGIEKSSKALNAFKIGILAAVAVIATLIAGFVKLGKAVLDTVTPFEYSVSKLAAILKTTSNGITDLTDNARALGAVTKYTASEVVGLQTELAKLGFKKQEILDSTGAVLAFSQAVGTDLSSAAALAGATLRSFGATTQEMERYVSAMAIATTNSALDFSKLQTSMPIVGAAAKAMGFEIEDTSALLGTLANAGLEASSAATALRNIFLNLANTSGDLSKAMGGNINSLDSFVEGLDRIQKSGADLGDVLQLTDKRSVVAFQNLLKNSGTLKELRNSLTDVSQAMYIMAETMEDNLQGSITRLDSAWEEFLISINNVIPFTKIKKAFTDMATSILTDINNLLNPTRAATEAYNDQFDKVSKLATSTEKLTKRYEELKGKTELNADEQSELNRIMETIKSTIPGVVTEFDKYGNALSINTKAAREWVETQIAMLEWQNKDAIREVNKELEKERKNYEKLGEELQKQTKLLEINRKAGVYWEYMEKQVKKTTAAYDESGDKIEKLENTLKGFTGETVRQSLKRAEYTAMSIEELDKEISANEKAADEISKSYSGMAQEIKDSKIDEAIEDLRVMSKKELTAWLNNANNTNEKLREVANEILKTYTLTPSEIKEIEDRNKEIEKLNEQRISSELAIQKKGLQNSIDLIENEFRVKIKAITGNGAAEVALREQLEKEKQKKITEVTEKWENERAKKDLENRLSFAKEGSDEELNIRLQLLEIQKKQELTQAESTGADLLLIEQKYADLMAKEQEKFALKRIDKMQESAASEAIVRDAELAKELSTLSKQYAEGIINKEKYEAKKLRITREYAIKNAQAAVDALEAQYEAEKALLSPEERVKMEEQITKAKIALSNLLTQKYVDDAKDREEADESWRKKAVEAIKFIADALNAFSELGSAIYDRKIQQVEEEQEANQAAYDADIERIDRLAETGAISAEEAEARKRAAEDRTAQKEAELAKQKAALQTKQAKLEKANNIMQIILSTAAAIMTAWKQLGAFGAPMAALIGALGAVQLATAIATPIPKYAKGTDNHPGGMAVVGDGGKQEAIITPTGKTFITPSIPTLVDLPSGSKVVPDYIDVLNLESLKTMRSDVGLMMKIAERNNEPVVIVNSDFSRLERGIDNLAELFAKSIKENKKSAYYAEYRSRINNIKPI